MGSGKAPAPGACRARRARERALRLQGSAGTAEPPSCIHQAARDAVKPERFTNGNKIQFNNLIPPHLQTARRHLFLTKRLLNQNSRCGSTLMVCLVGFPLWLRGRSPQPGVALSRVVLGGRNCSVVTLCCPDRWHSPASWAEAVPVLQASARCEQSTF